MGKYLYYIVALIAAGLMFLTYFFVNKKARNKVPLVHKIVSLVIFALFFVWLLLSEGGLLQNVVGSELFGPGLDKSSQALTLVAGYSISSTATFFVVLSVWLFALLHVTTLIAPFFKFPVAKRFERFVSPIIAIFCLVMLPWTIVHYSSSSSVNTCGILYAIELGVIIGKLVEQNIFERIPFKMGRIEIVELVLCILGAILFTMPDFAPLAIFGKPSTFGEVKGFATWHRYYIYMTLIFLVCLTLLLRNRKGEYSRMILLFVSIAGMINFSSGYSFRTFIQPYNWPLHICNTAMYILPIALTTRSQKVFYFTFFVNILGAFLAILMPNYGADLYFTSRRVVGFYINHIVAMAMPFVCVLTDVFPRPKKKQFFYSMVGFAVYYVMAIVFNTWFTAVWPKQEVDFFFINSPFVAEKIHMEFLLKDFTFTFTLNGMKFTMYPLYQVLYFGGFILLSIGMWYVYVWIFKFQDFCIHLNERSRKIRFDEIALTQKCGVKEVRKCMNQESVGKLIISHFGKRYSDKLPFAVRDINFVAESGEIIGFLGPNGAGKSTTIKAIVGIHLPTEGKIEVNGYDVEVQPVLAKKQIGFVPDHYALYENLTGREYLNYIADLYEVSQKDRDEFLNEFLETLAMKDAIDNKIQTYSHGMKQKIAIMASIIHDPKLWILDEPLTGLDPVSIFQVKQCLKRHAERGNIVFFSSHLIDIVEKLCDRIIIISNHQVVDVADVRELTKKKINLEQYYMEKTGLATGN